MKRRKEMVCKECGENVRVGNKTKQCLGCLDWKMSELEK